MNERVPLDGSGIANRFARQAPMWQVDPVVSGPPRPVRAPNGLSDAEMYLALQNLSLNAKRVLAFYARQKQAGRPLPSDNATSKRLNLKLRFVREAQHELIAAKLMAGKPMDQGHPPGAPVRAGLVPAPEDDDAGEEDGDA